METFRLKAKVYYTDGTDSGNVDALPQTNTLKLHEIVTYPVGFNQLGLHLLNPEKTPDFYEVWLNNGNAGNVAVKRRFYLRDREFEEVDIWFQNSLGVIEAVVFRLGKTHGVRVSKDEFQRFLPSNVDTTVHEIDTTDSKYVDEYKLTTGYLSLDTLRPHIDLLISKRIWLIENQKRIPVTIPAGEFQIVSEGKADGAYEYALNVTLIKAFVNRAYSRTL